MSEILKEKKQDLKEKLGLLIETAENQLEQIKNDIKDLKKFKLKQASKLIYDDISDIKGLIRSLDNGFSLETLGQEITSLINEIETLQILEGEVETEED